MNRQFATVMLCCCAFLLGSAAGSVGLFSPTVAAQDDKQPQAFLSGGARSEKVLKDIHSTLQQMDERVAAIEDLIRDSVGKPGSGSDTSGRNRR